MKPNELSKTIADYRYSQGAAMKRRVDMANASQDEADDHLLLQLEHETEHEAVEGILVDMGFDGMEAVDTTLPLDDDGNEMVPMDRVHADHRSEHVIRAQLSLDKVRGLPERKDPLLLDVLSGRRHGDKRLALEQAESNRVSQSANSTDPQSFGGIGMKDLQPLIDLEAGRRNVVISNNPDFIAASREQFPNGTPVYLAKDMPIVNLPVGEVFDETFTPEQAAAQDEILRGMRDARERNTIKSFIDRHQEGLGKSPASQALAAEMNARLDRAIHGPAAAELKSPTFHGIPITHEETMDYECAKPYFISYPLPATLLERLWHKVATLFGIRMDP